jgi:transglutaminase-like putative cysteine protease
MRIRVSHQTVYDYTPPAKSLIQTLRLTPRNHEGQYVVNWRIDVDAESRLKAGEDAFANITHSLTVSGPIERLTVTVEGVVETTTRRASSAEPSNASLPGSTCAKPVLRFPTTPSARWPTMYGQQAAPNPSPCFMSSWLVSMD